MNLTTFRSLNWADFFILSLVNPREMYKMIRDDEKKGFFLSFSVLFLVAFTDMLSSSLLETQSGFFYYKITNGLILLSLLYLFKLLVIVAIMDLVAQFFGFSGKAREMISLVNFSMFPMVFLLPFTLIFVSLNFSPDFFYFAGSLFFFVWFAFNMIVGISEMHEISFGKSFAIFILPVVFIAGFLFFSSLLILINLVGYVKFLI